MRTNFAAATALLLLVGACNKSSDVAEADRGNVADATAPANVDNSVAAPAAPLASADFANTVAGSGKFEIDSAAIAAKSASSADLKSLAAMISADHTKAGQELTTAANASTPSFRPMTSLTAKQKSDLTALEGATGAAFDSLYVTQQIAAHREAIAILTAYAAGGASPQLKDFATKTLPAVQAHLDKLLPMAK